MIRRHPFFFGVALLFVVLVIYAVVVGLSGITVSGNRIGIITVKGEILDAAPTLRLLTDVAKDDTIKAVVVRIESPGGGVAASQEIYTALQNLKSRKPVVASLGSIATSGGYYIACGANKIVANPGTLTGSISAAMFFHNFKGLMEKVGIKSGVIKGGKYKDIGSPLRDMTKEDAALLQTVIDDVSDQFISVVAHSRNITKKDVITIADGRVFTGRQAKAIGLVDELGGIAESVALAAKLANITGEAREVYLQEEKSSLVDYIFDGFARRIGSKIQILPHSELYYL